MADEKKIIVEGSKSIYRVAVEQYQDPDKFIAIMQENDLESPFIVQPQTVIIPKNPPDNKGEPTQPTGKGTGILPTTISYPYTFDLEDDVGTEQFAKGLIVSKTTGLGKPNVSPTNTSIIPGSASTIIDKRANKWNLVQLSTTSNAVTVNGVIDKSALNPIQLAFVDGKVWYENKDQLWFAKSRPSDAWAPFKGTAISPLIDLGLTPTPPSTQANVLPGSVSPLTTSVTPTSFFVFWTAPVGTQPIYYQVQYRISGSNQWLNIGSQSTATSLEITGLTPSTIYEVQVLSLNGLGPSESAPVVITVVTAFGATAPGKVTPVVSTIAPTSIVIGWSVPTGTAPFSYEVFYKLHTDTNYTSTQVVSALNEGITGLNPNSAYDFYVIATNSVGQSTPVIVSATTASLPVGAVPTPTITNIAQTTLTITWTAPTGTPPFTYKVYNRVTGTSNWNLLTSLSGLTANITGLQSQTPYDFEVIPSDATGPSIATPNIVSATTASTVTPPNQIALASTITARSTVSATLFTRSLTTRKWSQNPGQDGTFWVQPFKTTSNWLTTGPLVTTLRNGTHSTPTGVINLKGNYSTPWVVGTASDPIVTVRLVDGTKSIQVHIPLGTIIETPDSQYDNSIGGSDETQPYLVWSISGATMNTNGVQASGTVITGSYGLQIDDGSGPIMMDTVTGQPGTNNSIGTITDIELNAARADPNYVMQHMLTFQMDPSMVTSGSPSPVWPLKVIDGGATYTGSIPMGITVGIPSTTARPTGKSRGFYLLWDNLQQYGWFNYNFGSAGATFIDCYSNLSANNTLVTDLVNSISEVMGSVCILNYNSGTTGAQYSVATQKGMSTGGTNAYNAPPLLDYSPTGGQPVLPSSFGAWFPSGYNVISSGGSTGGTVTESTQGTLVTAIDTPIYDSQSEAFTITSGGTIAVNGTVDTTTRNVTTLLYYNHNVYQENAAGDWYYKSNASATWVGPTTDPRVTTVVSGQFSVSNGLIVDPNGNNFIARGINLNEYQLTAPVLTVFPGLNFIRLACHSYISASSLQSFVTSITNSSVVIAIEDHTGISAAPYTGSALSTETNWYASLASAFKNNSYVWFGTFNEPGGQNGGAAVTTQEVAIYNAIRGTGNSNPILMELISGGNPGTLGTNGGLTVSSYTTMTNIIWDLHQYDWITNSTDQSVIATSLSNQFTLVQQLRSADGLVPIIIGEYGVSTTGDLPDDPGGVQLCQAVQASGKGCAAWGWYTGGTSDLLTDGNNNLTTYGRQVAAWIASQVTTTQNNRIVAPLPSPVTTGTWVAKDLAVAGVTMPSGKNFHFNYLLPAQYTSSKTYPIMIWLHPDFDNGWYDNSNTDPLALTNFDAGTWYNTVNFRTNYPCISIIGYADQTSGNDAVDNWGGWINNGTTGSGTHASGDTGPNVFGLIGALKWILANFSGDLTRVYINGFSLGGIGAEYLMLKYNRLNGSQKLFTAASSTGGVLEINGFGVGPTSSDTSTMTNVPVWWVSGGNDTTSKPEDWNLPMWRALAGNSSYPAPGGTAAQAKAGSSQYHLWVDNQIGHSQTDSSGNPYPINPTILNWLFSQII